MRNIRQIILHCSATKENQDFCAADIDRWHKERGWVCIGYHYVIKLDGTIEKGRPDEEIGAHCKGHNAESIGVCYIGGCDEAGVAKDTRTEAQKQAMKSLCAQLLEKYPNASLYGHRDFEPKKECPCFSVASWWAQG
ncbi:N-acetylmuramoyl-L-alanine amidase [Helicobacter sp. NHP19-003]|uniref:N-acetylmuramoyl-L-alanine amidase n=1 Tax=Helicobacter gastrocanis TaxID=2849641 RepID=A0ABM7SBM5_9HELI|nr:N-acetylmuramoyl-L-alanine amidase [Helicobacter sp. NHP19-003]BCZ18067.1 N-acetylmuramoyl-L-alanine amidase [Helicobacter sp. NHP19-003]